jgi:hypothetical protein
MSNETTFHPNTEVIWIQKNRDFLWKNYAGQWIAVVGEELIAAGEDPKRVREEAESKGYPKALITGVRRREYQGVSMIR